MANSKLDKSTWWAGEPIAGNFIITVDQEDPAIPSIEILGSSLEFIIKDDKLKLDSDALAILTIGNGLEVVENTQFLYNVIYRIPGSMTSNLTPANARDPNITLFYEINLVYNDNDESSVLESGTLRIKTDRVKTF